MTDEESDYLERHGAVTNPVYPDNEESRVAEDFREALAEQRRRDCARIFESEADLIFSNRTERVAHMQASVAIAILKGNLDVGGIADHFRVTWTRLNRLPGRWPKTRLFVSRPMNKASAGILSPPNFTAP